MSFLQDSARLQERLRQPPSEQDFEGWPDAPLLLRGAPLPYQRVLGGADAAALRINDGRCLRSALTIDFLLPPWIMFVKTCATLWLAASMNVQTRYMQLFVGDCFVMTGICTHGLCFSKKDMQRVPPRYLPLRAGASPSRRTCSRGAR